MRKVVGISLKIKRKWLDSTLDRLTKTTDEADLRSFLKWAAVNLGYSELAAVEAAPPTAELEPLR